MVILRLLDSSRNPLLILLKIIRVVNKSIILVNLTNPKLLSKAIGALKIMV